jgi:hypothetical protein
LRPGPRPGLGALERVLAPGQIPESHRRTRVMRATKTLKPCPRRPEKEPDSIRPCLAMKTEAAFNRRMRAIRASGGVGRCRGAIPGTRPDRQRANLSGLRKFLPTAVWRHDSSGQPQKQAL